MVAHYYETIPGFFDFQDVYREMVRNAPDEATFVEVGSFLGKSLAFLAVEIVNSEKPIQLVSIDHLDVFRIPTVGPLFQEAEHVKAAPWDGFRLRHILERNLRPCTDRGLRYTHFQRPSFISTPFDHLDFVFLDACHDRVGIGEEIAAWWPKVKPGGFLGGHDHTTDFPGVIEAVRDAFGGKHTVRGNSFLIQKP